MDDRTVRIFATDLDPDAISYAPRGTYPGSSVEALPPDLVGRHFERISGDDAVRKHIRAITVFGHDLALRAPFPRIDLTLCRNVLI